MAHDPDDAIDDFHARLHALTPSARATMGLMAINVLVYIAMVARGDNGLWADARGLLAWGANFGPLTRAEWWRLITAPFLHGGLLHLALNMMALRSGGPLLERSLGPARFLAAYVLTAVAASLGSVLVSSHVVSVGASGAVFGVFGALLGIALHHAPAAERLSYLKPAWGRPRLSEEDARRAAHHAASAGPAVMPAHLARLLSTQIVGLVILNALIGLAVPVIDNAAHAAGFLAGLALGWIAAGAVSRRLASVTTSPGEPRAPDGLVNRSRWLVPAASLVLVTLAMNAVFPLLPEPVRLAILDRGCGAGSGAACLAAAREVRTATRGQLTPAARGYLERGCRAGSGPACTALALSSMTAGGRIAAARAFARACELGDAAGCRAWGALLETGQGVPLDLKQALAAYTRACDRQDGPSCLRLAEAWLQGRGVARDARRGMSLAETACDLGELRGCTVRGAQLAAAKDIAGALRAFDRACRGGEPLACFELGSRYETGNGVARDVKRAALAYYERACALRVGVACTRAGRLFERAPEALDLPKAAAMYEAGCRFGQAESCFNAGVMYAEGRGRAKDPAKALAYYEQACALGLKQICGLVAQLKGLAPGVPASASRPEQTP